MKMLKDTSSEDDVPGNTGSYSRAGKPQTSVNMFAFQLCGTDSQFPTLISANTKVYTHVNLHLQIPVSSCVHTKHILMLLL